MQAWRLEFFYVFIVVRRLAACGPIPRGFDARGWTNK